MSQHDLTDECTVDKDPNCGGSSDEGWNRQIMRIKGTREQQRSESQPQTGNGVMLLIS